ncbi:Inactive pancreatic lipase-related protein 1 [Eumeta japonica]|uniref:Inactive pancreatic lipase-related protein 1 n=1 Tax=Eumeta variegata TaxID=151549 RepID=A0A4C1TF78_EUMVA|nr:Inactive pancreatic lipase-related protein 1 [Eumeta japonica]
MTGESGCWRGDASPRSPISLIVLNSHPTAYAITRDAVEADDDAEPSPSGLYGIDWVLFPDDIGNLHFVNISRLLFGNSSLDEHQRMVRFELYTRKNRDYYEELFINENAECDGIENGNFTYYNPDNSLQVLVHGWHSSGQSDTILAMKEAYLNSGEVNVLVVDWSKIAGEMTYVIAAEMTKYVGKQTGKMIHSLMKRHCFDGRPVHLVGHSLGAHVSGYAGRYLGNQNLTVARITGLDPARPLFEIPTTEGLNATDATFVDIIHTNGGILGVRYARGHADFFPNGGGPSQPGCYESGNLPDACAHARSHQYFTESITHGGFASLSCENWSEYRSGTCATENKTHVTMGHKCPPTASGAVLSVCERCTDIFAGQYRVK